MKVKDIRTKIAARTCRSTWDRAVKKYMEELIEDFDPDDDLNKYNVKQKLLNGAQDWREYNYGGCALVYDYDIAERLCCPSEFKRRKYGELPPNSKETWLDAQGRALGKAAAEIKWIVRFSK